MQRPDETPQGKFATDSAVREVEPGVFDASVNRDWWIARGPNGGFLAAIITRALQASLPEDRQPRSLTIHYTAAPEEGPLRVETKIERAGRSMSTATARMEQGGRLIALAIGAFSLAREGAIDFDDLPAPDVPGLDDAFLIQSDRLPPFSRRFEMRAAIGGAPFTGDGEAVTGGWIRPEDPQAIDAPLVAQLTDAWFPAVFRRLPEPNPVPTIDLTIHFRAPLPLPADWVLARFASRVARDGFFEEDGELWSTDGRLIAQSRQLGLLQAPSQ